MSGDILPSAMAVDLEMLSDGKWHALLCVCVSEYVHQWERRREGGVGMICVRDVLCMHKSVCQFGRAD